MPLLTDIPNYFKKTFKGATAISAGLIGLVPAPGAGQQNAVLKGNSAWASLSASDIKAGNHKVFYSDGTGSIVELALGNSGEVLTSNGATSAPSFAAASGGSGEVRFDTSSSYTYTGLAAAGTSESTATWLIRRSEFDGAGSYVATLTANNVEWDDRLTASYT